MNATTHRPLGDILADLDNPPSPYGTGDEFYRELELAVRAQLAPLPEGEAERMAAQAEAAARTTAPPVPGVTRNGSYLVRAVIYAHPHQDGLLESWWVAAQETVSGGHWVTWNACRRDGSQAGTLAYDAGHYFNSSNPAVNRRAALADLAERAGLVPDMAQIIAREITGSSLSTTEELRVARGLRRWSGR